MVNKEGIPIKTTMDSSTTAIYGGMVNNINLNKHILNFWQIHFPLCTNTFSNLHKYILNFGQIHFPFCTNTFSNLHKYILNFGQIHIPLSTIKYWTLVKYVASLSLHLMIKYSIYRMNIFYLYINSLTMKK